MENFFRESERMESFANGKLNNSTMAVNSRSFSISAEGSEKRKLLEPNGLENHSLRRCEMNFNIGANPNGCLEVNSELGEGERVASVCKRLRRQFEFMKVESISRSSSFHLFHLASHPI